jgi:hypothetical protein
MTRIESRLNHKTAALPPGWRSNFYRAVVHATYLASDRLSRRQNCLWVCARPFSHANSSSTAISRLSPDVARHYSCCFVDEPERPLPRYLADEFGWEPMTQKTAEVFHWPSASGSGGYSHFRERLWRSRSNRFFRVLATACPHRSVRQRCIGSGVRVSMMARASSSLGSNGRGDHELFRSVEPTGRVADEYSRADERFIIFLCKDMRPSLGRLWPRIKVW